MVSGTTILHTALLAAVEELRTRASDLSELDSRAGDGDLGLTATNVAKAVESCVTGAAADVSPSDLLRRCGLAIAEAAPSSCGTLLATGFMRAGRDLSAADTDPRGQITGALRAAQEGIAERGRSDVGDKTILDSIAPTVQALTSAAGADFGEVLVASVKAAQVGAAETKSLAPRVGRAAWLPAAADGNVDAGAQLFAYAWTAGVDAILEQSEAQCAQ